MNKSIVVVLVCAFAMAHAAPSTIPLPLATPAQREVLERIQNNADFETIGQIGAKTFIAFTRRGHGMAARDVCGESGLEFATFEDDTEFDFVYENSKEDLWVSGVMRGPSDDARRDSFMWLNGELLSTRLSVYLYPGQWLCLYVAGDHLMSADGCFSGRHQTLCQLKLGQQGGRRGGL